MRFGNFNIFMIFMSFWVSLTASCDLPKCTGQRNAAEASFGENQSKFCRRLQEYLVCLRKLSQDCINDPHVQQVLSRYTISCQGSTAPPNDVRLSYFQSSSRGGVQNVDDIFDDVNERKGTKKNKEKRKEDLFDDIGGRSQKTKKDKSSTKYEKDDLYDDVGDDMISIDAFERKKGRRWKDKDESSKMIIRTDDKYDSRWGVSNGDWKLKNKLTKLSMLQRFSWDENDSDSEKVDWSFSEKDEFQGSDEIWTTSRNSFVRRNDDIAANYINLKSTSSESNESNELFDYDVFNLDENRHEKYTSDESGDVTESFMDDRLSDYEKYLESRLLQGDKQKLRSPLTYASQLSEYFDDFFDIDDQINTGNSYENFYWDDFENDIDNDDFKYSNHVYTNKHKDRDDFEDFGETDVERDDHMDEKFEDEQEHYKEYFTENTNGIKEELNDLWGLDSNEDINMEQKSKGKKRQFAYFDSDFDSKNGDSEDNFDDEFVPYLFPYDSDSSDSGTLGEIENIDDESIEMKTKSFDSDSQEIGKQSSDRWQPERTLKLQQTINQKGNIKNNVVPLGLEFFSNNIPLSKKLGIILDENASTKPAHTSEGIDPVVRRQKLKNRGIENWLFKNKLSDTAFHAGNSNGCCMLESSKIVVMWIFFMVIRIFS